MNERPLNFKDATYIKALEARKIKFERSIFEQFIF